MQGNKYTIRFGIRFETLLCLIFYSNPTGIKETMMDKKPCLSAAGIPMQPFVILGGFIPKDTIGFPENPKYEKADAVVMTFLVDNYDINDPDPMIQRKLKQAKDWESAFIEFMQDWESNSNNTEYMDVAYNSERSIEDELDRETYGDIMTIAVSYIFMFIYITFSLGKISKLSRFAIESKVRIH